MGEGLGGWISNLFSGSGTGIDLDTSAITGYDASSPISDIVTGTDFAGNVGQFDLDSPFLKPGSVTSAFGSGIGGEISEFNNLGSEGLGLNNNMLNKPIGNIINPGSQINTNASTDSSSIFGKAGLGDLYKIGQLGLGYSMYQDQKEKDKFAMDTTRLNAQNAYVARENKAKSDNDIAYQMSGGDPKYLNKESGYQNPEQYLGK